MEELRRMVFFLLIDEQEGEVEGRGVLVDLKMGRVRPCHPKRKIMKLDQMTVSLLVVVSFILVLFYVLCFML